MNFLRFAVFPLLVTTATAATPPYPPSPVIARVEFDFSTHRRLAPGNDNWPDERRPAALVG